MPFLPNGQEYYIDESGQAVAGHDPYQSIRDAAAGGQQAQATQGMAAAPMTPPPTPAAPPTNPMDPQQILSQLRQLVVSQIVPQRQQALLGVIPWFQALANASPQALLTALASQLPQLRRGAIGQQQSLSRQLGPEGGGQIQRGQHQVTQSLAETLAQLLGQTAAGGEPALMDIAQGTSTMLPSAARTSQGIGTQRQTGWPGMQQVGSELLGLIGLGGALGRGVGALGGLFPTPSGLTTGTEIGGMINQIAPTGLEGIIPFM